ncbi:MAG: argininosuccinate lyase [Gammaproteobacteria bacterium]|nr:MAG: argininosuccinate lyase [Gammaproteobacteria bacterium]
MSEKKLWGGRFTAPTDQFVETYTASVAFDRRLYRQDIAGSIAHATMLARVGVLTDTERDAIVEGLQKIEKEIEAGRFEWRIEREDVHMNVEARLIELIGDLGKKLHTGRSRNDQVATDIRLYVRDGIDAIDAGLQALQERLLDVAEHEVETLMPGFTHLQVAQPVTLGHHIMAWYEMLSRDRARFQDCRKRVNIMPLGAAALAGTSYPLDRTYTAKMLGFDAPARNSLDAVSDRDFVIEFISASSLLMTHLSRISEELIIWSSTQFGFVELGDAYCTGSSIMPQKKNPDVPELVRGKTGRVTGALMSMLMLMKAQPLAYNKDNQEDKEPLFDVMDTVLDTLQVYTGMMGDITFHREAMLKAAASGFSTATDLADYLVRQGLPFRDAHEVVGRLVALGVKAGRDLSEMSLHELQAASDVIQEDVFAVLTLAGSVAARSHLGGTAPEQVRQAIAEARQQLSDL